MHITNALQASSLGVAQLVTMPARVRWISAGGLNTMVASARDYATGMGITLTQVWYWTLLVGGMAPGPLSWPMVMYDIFEGRSKKDVIAEDHHKSIKCYIAEPPTRGASCPPDRGAFQSEGKPRAPDADHN